MTKISFECSGGMLYRKLDLTLQLDRLPSRESLKLLRLIQGADFFNLPSNLIRHPEPEKIQYTITVDNGLTRHRVRANENSTPSALRPLINELSMRLDTGA